jgi:Zn-dependent protease
MYIAQFFNDPLLTLIFLACIVITVTVHEFAHAWAADELGDPTARLLGRKSLDPRKHLDPWGSLLFILAGFGWGKPVPVDSFNLREEAKDNALIALAGPASNLLIAALLGTIYRFGGAEVPVLGEVLLLFGNLNVYLAVFNLLPIPPLDGSKLYRAVLPSGFDPIWRFLDQFGIYILLFMFLSGSSLFGFLRPMAAWLMNLFGF